jgi:hypothetical protein
VKLSTIESDHKVQLPLEWVEELGLHGFVALEKGPNGIIVRSCSDITWDEVFADKLFVGSCVTAPDLSEVSGDDYLI